MSRMVVFTIDGAGAGGTRIVSRQALQKRKRLHPEVPHDHAAPIQRVSRKSVELKFISRQSVDACVDHGPVPAALPEVVPEDVSRETAYPRPARADHFTSGRQAQVINNDGIRGSLQEDHLQVAEDDQDFEFDWGADDMPYASDAAAEPDPGHVADGQVAVPAAASDHDHDIDKERKTSNPPPDPGGAGGIGPANDEDEDADGGQESVPNYERLDASVVPRTSVESNAEDEKLKLRESSHMLPRVS
jgi:hypothetical protein